MHRIIMESEYYRAALRNELAKRHERNPRYSVRAFAKALKVDPGVLSRVLSGNRVPSEKLARRLLTRLELGPKEERRFLASIASKHRSRGLQRMNPFFQTLKSVDTPTELSIDLFRVISDWYHAAILEMTFVEGFKPTPQWIARNLQISVSEADMAIERMIQLGLLEWKGDKLVKAQDQLTTADKHITTPALRRHQKQILEKAIHSLENDPIEVRNMSAMTMAIDPSLVPAARKMVSEFMRAMCRFLESGSRQRVYELAVSLYPVQIDSQESKNESV
jgi:uncharacterized protein (TIGR02147 family)